MDLLHPDDFMGMGVGLADARLLIEKYKTNLRRDELQAIVHDIRTRKSKEPSQKRPKKSTVCVDLAWYHYGPGKSFPSVKLKDDGGSRRYSFERTAKLDEVYQKLKDIYFPNGKDTKKGYLVNLNCNMCDLNLQNVNLNKTLSDYIRNNGFKYRKLILKTKKKMFFKDLTDITSDEDDFSLKKFSKKRIKVKNTDSKSISQYQHYQIQIHIFVMQPRVLMAIVINPPKAVLEKIYHGNGQGEKRVILVL